MAGTPEISGRKLADSAGAWVEYEMGCEKNAGLGKDTTREGRNSRGGGGRTEGHTAGAGSQGRRSRNFGY